MNNCTFLSHKCTMNLNAVTTVKQTVIITTEVRYLAQILNHWYLEATKIRLYLLVISE